MKITATIPAGTSITDYTYLSLKISAGESALMSSDSYGKKVRVEMQGGNYLQGVGNSSTSTGNILIGESGQLGSESEVADGKAELLAASANQTLKIKLNWSEKDKIKSSLTGNVQFVVGLEGQAVDSVYSISDVKLLG